MSKGLTIFLLLLPLTCLAQEKREVKSAIRKGNEAYKKEQYEKAMSAYDQALASDPASFKSAFNKADALFKQQKYEEAAVQFKQLAEQSDDPKLSSAAYHNAGNSLLMSGKIQESIDAYKQALRNNPEDDQTRYNLAYANQLLKKKQQQQNNKDKNKDQKKDQKKEQNKDQNKEQNKDQKKDQKKDQNKDQKKEQNKDQKKDQKKDQSKNQNKKAQQQLSPKDAERMLNALQRDEKDIQKALKKQKAVKAKNKIQKNW